MNFPNEKILNSKILVVDDEQRWADQIAALLREQGYNSVHVSYGITKFADLLDDYDLAVLDIRMPRYDGITLKNHLLYYSQKTRIVLISGLKNYDVDLLNQTRGVDGWITKETLVKDPYAFFMLVNKILEKGPKLVLPPTGDDLLENIIIDCGHASDMQSLHQCKIISILRQLKISIANTQDEALRDFALCIDALAIALSKKKKRCRSVDKTLNDIKQQSDLFPDQDRRRLIGDLESILTELNLIPNTCSAGEPRVFIAHGHDEVAKLTVARFIEEMGMTPVILAEQANIGRTIIEKFEQNADVSFAVVILTPDDTAFLRGRDANACFRARQNVILELGYFFAKLGRKKVCALHKAQVEIPSDIHGVLCIPMDEGEGWKMRLAKEMKDAGIPVALSL
jgi:CheY-like chemotaxis protein